MGGILQGIWVGFIVRVKAGFLELTGELLIPFFRCTGSGPGGK